MPRDPLVFLQPAGGPDATKHYEETIARPVSLQRCAGALSSHEIADLAAIYGREGARVWGVTPGKTASKRGYWEQMESGDAVLFCGSGQVFAYAFVTHTLQSKRLAKELWGTDETGQTWEYIFFVHRPVALSVPVSRVAKLIGFAEGFVVQRFMALNAAQSEAVWRGMPLPAD